MYLFLTTKCNMACLHCCHNCRPGKGQHMPMEVFKKACAFARRCKKDITIGGGEPTLHPQLLEMLPMAIKTHDRANVFMVTNGSCSTELWKALLALDHFDMHVSNSIFHNKALQNPFVIRSAARRGRIWDGPATYNKYITLEDDGRAARSHKKIEALAKKKRYTVEYTVSYNSGPCVFPDGQVGQYSSGELVMYGPLSSKTYWKAYNEEMSS